MKQARTSLDGGFLKILAKDAVLPRLSKIKPSRPRDAGLDSRRSSEGRGRSSQEAVESLRCETLWKSKSEGRTLKVDIGFLALAASHGHQEENFLLCRTPHTSPPEAYGQHAHEVRSHNKFLPV